MLLRIYLVISVFSTGLLFAQAKISNPDRETIGSVQQKGDEKTASTNSPSAKAVIQSISTMEKSIAMKVADLERLQNEAAEFNPDMKKEIRIVYEKPINNPIPGPQKYLVYRYVEMEIEGGNKIKEIRVISRHRSLTEDMNSIMKVVSFTPGNTDSIKVTIDKLETKAKGVSEVGNYKDFAPEVKLQALKTIDNNLFNSIYRLDAFIQRSQITKNDKNKNQLQGL
jgi:hypothetical protein